VTLASGWVFVRLGTPIVGSYREPAR
jgi:hypothetical protein